jgi:hypothetical protein
VRSVLFALALAAACVTPPPTEGAREASATPTPAACEGAVVCGPGLAFDPSPGVCDCVPATTRGACARTRCEAGTRCVEADDGRARCVTTD